LENLNDWEIRASAHVLSYRFLARWWNPNLHWNLQKKLAILIYADDGPSC